MKKLRCAILDDYQNVALGMADWSSLADAVEITVFSDPLGNQATVISELESFNIVCLMRERTPFLRPVLEGLPNLELLVTTGIRNAAIDLVAAHEQGVVVCGTQMGGHATAELAFAHILEFCRRVGQENTRLKAGGAWQNTIGTDLNGKTLGIIGLGRLGRQVARIGAAFGMDVIAWSENLTPEKCADTSATYEEKDALISRADFISVHVRLSDRTRNLIGAREIAKMKPTAVLINTSRGEIVDEDALIDALREKHIGGVGLDVFCVEPLPLASPLRSLERAQITPHLGYVTEGSYRIAYGQTVENIAAYLSGKPIRLIHE